MKLTDVDQFEVERALISDDKRSPKAFTVDRERPALRPRFLANCHGLSF